MPTTAAIVAVMAMDISSDNACSLTHSQFDTEALQPASMPQSIMGQLGSENQRQGCIEKRRPVRFLIKGHPGRASATDSRLQCGRCPVPNSNFQINVTNATHPTASTTSQISETW